MDAITLFCSQFGVTFEVPEGFVLRSIGKNLHLFTLEQAKMVDSKQPIVGGGILLGSLQKKEFMPSAQFLDMYLVHSPHRIILNEKVAWLFLCGRDILDSQDITLPINLQQSGARVVILDEAKNILGYGVMSNPHRNYDKVLIKNLYDKGNLLRREMDK